MLEIENEIAEIGITDKPICRERWGLMFFVATNWLSQDNTKTILELIHQFKETYNISTPAATLKTDYYRLMALHKEFTKHGV